MNITRALLPDEGRHVVLEDPRDLVCESGKCPFCQSLLQNPECRNGRAFLFRSRSPGTDPPLHFQRPSSCCSKPQTLEPLALPADLPKC